MPKTLENTVAVLLVTLVTTMAIYAGVSLAEDPLSAAVSDAETSGALQTCPATGCTSYGCHATEGTGSPTQRNGGHSHDGWNNGTSPQSPAPDSGVSESDGLSI